MLNAESLQGKAVVIGAGTMGGGIAAQLANAGWQVWLLDVAGSVDAADKRTRNQVAQVGLQRIRTNRPPLLFLSEFAERIHPGNMEDDLQQMRDADWVVEAVAERMDVKQAVMAQIEAHAGPETVVSSNTSGLSLREMSAGRSESFRSRFLGTHFLNPPRYLKLLEVVALSTTRSDVAAGFIQFAEQVLGHRVVRAKDTPGFISTRIWIFHLLHTIHKAIEYGLTVEQVDYLTGPLLGRPRSATFRMADLVGLDIIAAIAANQRALLPHDPFRQWLLLPDVMHRLIAEGRVGDKSAAGFYKRAGREILTLDLSTLEYCPRQEPVLEAEGEKGRGAEGETSREEEKGRKGERERQAIVQKLPLPRELASVLGARGEGGGLGGEGEAALPARFRRLGWMSLSRTEPWHAFLSDILNGLISYAEAVGPETADDVLAIDNVMKWGFGWEAGPFEIADWLFDSPLLTAREESRSRPPLPSEERAEKGEGIRGEGEPRFYTGQGLNRRMKVFGHKELQPIPQTPEYIVLSELKAAGKTVLETPAASLIDLDGGAACLAFHTKLNTFDPTLCDAVNRLRERAERDFTALVIGNQEAHFSAGYNVRLLLDLAQSGNWLAMDTALHEVQQTFQGLKYARIPIAAAPHGYTLGAGCECVLHCAQVQAGPELTMGLPELLVGLVPAGGACKELLQRNFIGWTPEEDPYDRVERVFDLIAFPRNSGSAVEARKMGLLRSADGISRNADRRLYDAKQRALQMANAGYQPPVKQDVWVFGVNMLARLRMKLHWSYRAGAISEHDRRIADQSAYILCGGNLPSAQQVSEEYLLGLERTGLIELAHHQLTQARMQHMLDTGKPLKN